MEVEEMNRFLQSVHKTRFIDYLSPVDGEAAEGALDRRLRWAARSRNVPDDAAEANFLLQHRDALREHLSTAKAEIAEDEWLEFTEEEPSNVRVNVYSSSTARESIDFDNLLPSPKPPPVRAVRPDGTGVPTGIRESTPTPTIQAQRVLEEGHPLPEDAFQPVTQPAAGRSPSPLLDRVRRNSPGAVVPRQSVRPATPSPPLANSRTQTPPPGATPRPRPDRWSAAPPGSRTFATQTPGIEVRDQGPAYSPPQVRTPTPSPTIARNATPNSFDVRIKGNARFVQSGDRFGSSEVVYESDMRGGHTQTPSPHRTPSGVARRGEASRSDDILGSLRGSVRQGAGNIPIMRRKVPLVIPPAAWLGIALLVVTVLSVGTLGVRYEFIDIGDWLGLGPADESTQTTAYEATAPAAIAPIAPVITVDTDAAVDAGSDPDGSIGSNPAGVVIPSTTDKPPTATPDKPPAATKPPRDKPPRDKPAGTTKPATADKPAAADKPAGTTKPGDDTTPVATDKPDPATKPAGGTDAVVVPDPPAKPVVAKPPLHGAWNGSVGSAACLADFTQKEEAVRGTITVAGIQYQVTGRYNPTQKSIYLRGSNDPNVIFKGTVAGKRVDGQARLGAGQLYQVWQLR